MDKTKSFEVKDIKLADQGVMNIEFAEQRMLALMLIKRRFEKERPFENIRIGLALHVTKETGVLVRTLAAGGADIAITGCNPLSTQDDIAAALAKEGVKIWAYKGEAKDDYYTYIKRVMNFRPNITIDDGCDLVSEIHKNNADLIDGIIGGCEETTTGVIRLMAMEKARALKYPMVAVNSNKTKYLLDNYYGTGQSTVDGILRATNILFAGKTVVVIGYGNCGKGFALRAKGSGANVIVTEVNKFRALQAVYDGFRVMKIEEASLEGDVFCTLTGNKHVIRTDHVKTMKNGAILANAGHFDVEIDINGIENIAKSKRRVRPNLDEYVLTDGKRIFICGEGRLINLAAAEGHPSEVMSTSFCGQALAVEYCVKNREKLMNKVYNLPNEIDESISALQLKAMNIEIDELTESQIKYLNSWEDGT